jgi:hypothetical protein
MQPAIQPACLSRPVMGFRFVVAVLTILAACEVVILQLYVGAMTRMTTLSLDLEYARGSALIASARAQRCGSLADQK